MTTIVDGTTGITFPSAIAGVSATQQYSSRVLQVQTGYAGAQQSTTSTSYVDSTLSASITPISSSSKILVCVTICGIYIANAGNYLQAGIVRGSTVVVDNFTGAGPGYNGSNGGTGGSGSVNYLDSPSTTSSTTYKVQYKSTTSSQAVYLMNGGGPISSMILMEIAA